MAVALFVLALTHRLFFLASNTDTTWGFSIFYEGDSETFYNYARSILAGVPYDSGIPFHPPAWPRFLAVIHEWVGAGSVTSQVPHVQVRAWTAVLGSLCVPALFWVARRYVGRGVALAAALLATYSFGLYVISVAPVSESFYLLVLLTCCGLLAGLPHPLGAAAGAPGSAPSGRAPGASTSGASAADGSASSNSPATFLRAAGLGVGLGLLSLTRAEGLGVALLIIGLGLAAALWRTSRAKAPASAGSRWRSTAVWGLAALAFVLTLLPWTIRNHQTLSRFNTQFGDQVEAPLPTFAPVTAYGPLNFALANNDLADGTFSREILTSGAKVAVLDLKDPQHYDYFLNGYGIGWDWIASHPTEFLGLVFERWKLFGDSLTLGWTQWNLPGGLNGVRRPVDLFVPDRGWLSWILLPLIVTGLVLQLRAGGAPRRWALLTLALTSVGMLATGAFFGYARLGVLLTPVWMTQVVTSLRAMWSLTRRRNDTADPAARTREPGSDLFQWQPAFLGRESGRSRWVWLAPVILLLILEAWGATGERDYRATGTQLEGASHLNPHDEMRLEVIDQ